MRTSCRVAAKRIWPTSDDRRSAASSDMSPTRARPTPATASDTTTAIAPGPHQRAGATPRLPQAAAGWATEPDAVGHRPGDEGDAQRWPAATPRRAEVHRATP